MTPKITEERKLWRQGYQFVACIDEAGRGPLAGPVVAAAVVLTKPSLGRPKLGLSKLRDSKKLSPKRREEIYAKVVKHPAIQWGIGIVSEKVIDKINILQATQLAMRKAISHLETKLQKNHHIAKHCYSKKMLYIDFLIVDGNKELSFMNISCKAIVKGDEKVFSCALASIIAKVTRDRMMVRYHKKYSQYGFDKHKGYGTPLHTAMLKKYGLCPIHRRSFTPVDTMLKFQIRNSKLETISKSKYSKSKMFRI